VIGVSGGVDSSYLAYLTKAWGLRPLAVHFDNGWDSELAVHNIHTLLSNLDIDLITHVVDWDEFRDIQLAFFRASVIDIELPTDNAIVALLLRVAAERRVKTILRGNNDTTEAVMPSAWNHRKTDARNIKAIHRQLGTVPLKTLPTVSTLQLLTTQAIRRIRAINILDRVEYDREDALRILVEDLGWRPYEGKHHESIFTRFYQAQVLPQKFDVDKRRAHLSSWINSGEITRDAALAVLEEPPIDPDLAMRDRQYALKKLGVDDATFDGWMATPPRSHDEFASEAKLIATLVGMKRRLRRT
jgi:hypothetical protein